MKRNVGTIDKTIRLLLALVLFASGFIFEGNIRFMALAGVIPFTTAIISFCPLFGLFKIKRSTISNNKVF